MNHNILAFLEFIERRPQMVLPGEVNFSTMEAFFVGYLQGLSIKAQKDLHLELSESIQKALNLRSNLFWPILIKTHYQNKSDNELVQIMMKFVKDFFVANPEFR